MKVNERQKFILRALLLHGISNLDKVNAFWDNDQCLSPSWQLPPNSDNGIDVNGDLGERIAEDEIEELMNQLQ